MSDNASIEEFLQQAINHRQESGLYRSLSLNNASNIDFCSNDYLGFVYHKKLQHTGGESGSTGSRLISGNSALAEETETRIADFHHAEAALIFNSGYTANTGLFSAISDKHSTIIYDEHCHASIIDGMRLGYAARHKFKHNNIADLQKKLKLAKGRLYVAVESVYSMDGDLAPLHDIASLCRQYGAGLIVDEAHATGLYGDKGEGLVSAQGLEDLVFARVHTFGKALGHHGAAILGSKLLKAYLINHARPFIYTTALPPHSYTIIQQAYNLLPDAGRNKLWELTEYFRTKAANLPFSCLLNDSPIQAVMVPGNSRALALAEHLKNDGFYVKAILSPTVPEGTERIRICLHSFNTKEQADSLCESIRSFNT